MSKTIYFIIYKIYIDIICIHKVKYTFSKEDDNKYSRHDKGEERDCSSTLLPYLKLLKYYLL